MPKFQSKIWKYLKIFLINRKLHLKNQLWPIIQIIFNLIEPIYDEKSFQIFQFFWKFLRFFVISWSRWIYFPFGKTLNFRVWTLMIRKFKLKFVEIKISNFHDRNKLILLARKVNLRKCSHTENPSVGFIWILFKTMSVFKIFAFLRKKESCHLIGSNENRIRIDFVSVFREK